MGSEVMDQLSQMRPTEQQFGMRPDMNAQMTAMGMNPMGVGAPQTGMSAPTHAPFQVQNGMDRQADMPSAFRAGPVNTNPGAQTMGQNTPPGFTGGGGDFRSKIAMMLSRLGK